MADRHQHFLQFTKKVIDVNSSKNGKNEIKKVNNASKKTVNKKK